MGRSFTTTAASLYGYGSLKHALDRAKSHLDFCAVTGHAMWPDIPERNEETAFVVDFHRRGFQKLYDHWEEVRHTIAEANTEDFITFQAYEMHPLCTGTIILSLLTTAFL